MKTAYDIGLVPSNYSTTYDTIGNEELYANTISHDILATLNNKQLISLIATEFRHDHFCEGCLISRYVADGILLFYLKELQKRYQTKEGVTVDKSNEFKSNVIEQLGNYVYVYSDPDTKIPFYIGKGKGNRCFAHLYEESDKDKVKKIKEIKARGKEPLIEILVHGIDEETAFKVEAAAIDLIGVDNLTNMQKGHHSSAYGRISVNDLNLRYNQEELSLEDISDDVIMIRINRNYSYGMSDFELYEMTRCCWKVNKQQADKVKYAFAVYDGMVMEVYQITAWLPAYSTMHTFEKPESTAKQDKNRYEFVGTVANSEIRNKYIGKMVSNLFSKGNQNPIKYILHESNTKICGMTKDEINQILSKATFQQGLNKYIWIQDHVHTCDVSTNTEFQKRFNGFYRLRQRKPEFYKTYYDFMEKHKKSNPSFEETLHFFSQSLKRIEASFSSKLIATINPSKPIWDSIVLKNIGLKVPAESSKNREEKIVNLYQSLVNWYEDYLKSDEAKRMIECFHQHYPDTSLSNIKIIDFILWQKRDS